MITLSSDELERAERRLLELVPGGTQLLSKRPEQFAPGQWPRFYQRAKGARVWDVVGREFLDMSTSGIGTCTLGFANDEVDAAVHQAVDRGSMTTLNCAEDLELAELLIELHPWADMVRYARTGGEAMTVAVRLARAATGRSLVAFCGYHGWHDWYLAANLAGSAELDGHLLPGLEPLGVPRELVGTAVPFRYNRLEDLEEIVRSRGSELAAVVMEPVRGSAPEPGFLEGVRDLAHSAGAVLVFDEVTSGLRLNTGGVHLTYGVDPDVAVFAKALANGFPMAAIIGVESVMETAQRSFVSSSYWTELVGPVAAIATLTLHRQLDVGRRLAELGDRVQQGWLDAAARAGIGVSVSGIPPLSHLAFHDEPQATATLFTQELLDRGFLAGRSFYASFAHTDEDIDAYLDAVDDVFETLAASLASGTVTQRLRGPVAQTGFTRLT
ncbi:MAG: aminotransferase class III-fold pyridoxal phosphate-dependent enzyme [Frankiales bacterium]|nr:aminotransferase class III-fold pyridoxal phosphate-dependent enzyme [Frankiales bacterium]